MFGNRRIIGLFICSLVFSLQAFAGARSSGGAFYGWVKGEWVLLDLIEEGKVIYPDQEPYFEEVEKVLLRLDSAVPAFSRELRAALTNKSWHLVPFQLRCEDPETILTLGKTAIGCQDENDVWIEESKFHWIRKSDFILHELIQSVRLTKNPSLPPEHQIPASAVRGLFRVLSQKPFPTENLLKLRLASYRFGDYQTNSESLEQRRNAQERAHSTVAFAKERLLKRIDQWVQVLEWYKGSTPADTQGTPTFESLRVIKSQFEKRADTFRRLWQDLSELLVSDTNVDETEDHLNGDEGFAREKTIDRNFDLIRQDLFSSKYEASRARPDAIEREISRYQILRDIVSTLTLENLPGISEQIDESLRRSPSLPVDLRR